MCGVMKWLLERVRLMESNMSGKRAQATKTRQAAEPIRKQTTEARSRARGSDREVDIKIPARRFFQLRNPVAVYLPVRAEQSNLLWVVLSSDPHTRRCFQILSSSWARLCGQNNIFLGSHIGAMAISLRMRLHDLHSNQLLSSRTSAPWDVGHS